MSCGGTSDCTCGCCAGVAVETPQGESNLPGLSAIAYRTGTWATFKQSMLARLSSAEYPALARLKTRDDDDFSIALLDAAAVMLDILTFYQERLANESYLRTATQLRSMVELSRLIGYEPAPGVAAQAYLAFTLKAALGQPANPSTAAITIPQGTQVQSVPAQGQTAQIFETSADILAKPDWNALPVQSAIPWIAPGESGIVLAGTSTQLSPGDALLILGLEREEWTPSSTPNEQWDVVILNQVTPDTQNNITYAAWDRRLWHGTGTGESSSAATWKSAKIFALRQKAALFGNNAPSPYLFTNANNTAKTSLPGLIDDSGSTWQWKWNNFRIPSSSSIYLDAMYSKIAAGSWFVLQLEDTVQLYKTTSSYPASLAQYALSSKVTTLAADFEDPDISAFPLQGTAVLAQSEQLAVAEQPLDHPLYGTIIDLDGLRPDLAAVKAVAITGNAQKLMVKTGTKTLVFEPDDASGNLKLKPVDTVTIIDPRPLPLEKTGEIPNWSGDAKIRALRVADASGRTGTLHAELDDFTLADAAKSDPVLMEVALVSQVGFSGTPYPHTQLFLANPLINCYNRDVTTVNANVGLATAGSTVSEIMGSGSAATPNQSFNLKQTPLTYVQAATPTGRQSTLTVTANGVAWTEVPTLYEQGPSQQVFSVQNQPGGGTTVEFGDGVEGAPPPTGQNNVQAKYRVGSGAAGNVAAGAITTLVDRPLGVSGVTNPQAATGGQDAQSVNDIRANAPLSVLTLGRAVSIADYQNFAASFAGIAKASAIWVPSGPGRGVFLTVAGAGGAALPAGNPTLAQLIAAFQAYGNPLIPIHAFSFLETLFSVKADLTYEPSANAATIKVVNAAVIAALQAAYCFSNRMFGQGVTADEVATLIQGVPGVVAVNVKQIKAGLTSAAGDITGSNWSLLAYQNWLAQLVTLTRPTAGCNRICPYVPVASLSGLPQPAEILVLNPDPNAVTLGVMQ
ncbi:MAG TPA: putative baseplate assembly protein [Terracidiphilus sp.]|nr:putative baseplate assembly protein [Terracidiphilus sp.]